MKAKGHVLQVACWLLVSLSLALSACSPTVATTAAPDVEPTEGEVATSEPAMEELSGEMSVSVEAWMVDKYNMQELVARFEQAHPDVKVNLLTHEGLGANYLTMFLEWEQTQKSTADLYFGGLVSQLSPAVIDDQLLPWDDMLVDDLAPDQWIKAFLDGAYVPGPAGSNYPTLPGLGETMNFQVNMKYVKAAGIENWTVPASYADLEALACKLAETPVNDKQITGLEMEYGINFAPDTWMAAVIAAEGTYLTPDGEINWDSQAGRDWIEFQKKIIDQGCGGTLTFTDNNGARNGLKAGQIAIINASNSRSTEANVVLGRDVIQMFAYPGDGGTLAFSHQIYIPKVAARPDLARAFAREAILGEYGQTWSADHYGKMPTLWVNYNALAMTDPNFVEVRRELEGPTQSQWKFRDGQALRQAYVDELQLYLTGSQSLDDMISHLKEIQDQADLSVPGQE